ncbi:coiled-coil domain-containing protein 172 isoform 2 [Mus musculus]|uniref:Isoform 2 of Coiled-coil domain-containing protein 172 n=1 Tax=Mus musculus TaxID=10090 RepID=Q810N9-2|nr:coiled-coil domain-containing protein 172 isoform 2 [Mus musculus]EDL01799.1 RIKEN cDNA 1700011F14, isoform CRA_a [Mus musculus]BAB24284.1 unnamed protein product [Mus musculus]
MSLESLFQHIIFSEHQAEESRRVMREVRSEITRCRGKIKKATEDLSEEKIKLESKVQQLSEKSFLLELLKTHENALERQLSEIISERDTLLQACEAIKNKTTEEEERFIKEITDFNDNYEITKKRDTLMKENIEMEMADLDSQADVLRRDRLKRELDLYKAEDMESVYRALQAEVDLLELALAPKDPQDSNSLSHEPPHT